MNNSVYYQKLSRWLDPEQVFLTLVAQSPYSFWLDSSMVKENLSRFSYMGIPDEIITYSLAQNSLTVEKNGNTKQYSQDIFSFLKQQLAERFSEEKNLPFDFIGGYVGYFGYELKALCDANTIYKSPYPDSLWYYVDKTIVFDHLEKAVYLVCLVNTHSESEGWFEAIQKKLNNVIPRSATEKESSTESPPLSDKINQPKFNLSRNHQQYLKNIATCKEYLRNGDSYQICLTNTLTTDADVDPLTLYRILRKSNPAPYAAYIRYNDLSIICSSPEQFLKIDKNKHVESKPIKGTIARGKTQKEDKKLVNELLTSEKERAENLMIVDLVRNDLGKVCKIGSVHVPRLITLESYQTLHQLVSTIRGTLRNDVSPIDCIKACFPGGSMTGAPKIRTMEIIDSLEKKARGIYSGSIGYLGVNNTASLNIVIRTIITKDKKLSIGAGGAILIQSNPEKEYEEMLLKTKALVGATTDAYNTNTMHTVYLALGSNIGDKKKHIKNAIALLQKHMKSVRVAEFYENKPMYYEKQDDFINTVLMGQTELSPEELFTIVKQTEKEIGRVKRFRNGPREIDIDILFYDNLVLNSKTLQVPHPRIQERDFVLNPFMKLSPNFLHPVLQRSIKQLQNDLLKK